MNKIAKIFCIGLLLNLGVTSTAQAWSWESIKQSITNAIDNKLFLLSAAGIATIGIMGYMLYKSRNGKTPSQAPIITHIPVLRQQSDAMCGFHSLKNALLAVEMHNFNQDWKSLKNGDHSRLIDRDHFDPLIKNWKPIVIQKRKKEALQKRIQDHLKQYIDVTDQHKKYRMDIDNIGHNKAEHFIDVDENGQFTLNQQTAVWLIQQLNTNKTNDDILKEIPKLQKFEQLIVENEQLQADIIGKYDSLDEWLEGDEPKILLNTATNLKEIKDCISVIDDVNQITSLLADGSYTEAFEDGSSEKIIIPNPIRKKWKQKDCIHVFIVGTMSQKNANSKGHWFTVVAEKKDGKAQFFTMDSLGTNRTKDRRVRKIITALN